MPRVSPAEVMLNSRLPPKEHLDLGVIDEAHGKYADLYGDVLRVSVAATPEQIQMAYFDRRSELFTLLADADAKPQTDSTVMERLHAERQMDAVVLAVRILGDPEQRLAYDRMRQGRLLNRRRAKQGQLPGHESLVQGLDGEAENPEEEERRRRNVRRERRVKLKKHHQEPEIPMVSNRSMEESSRTLDTTGTDEVRQDDGESTVFTLTSDVEEKPKHNGGSLSWFSQSRFLRKISSEISGACEDTLVSVDQVFNAFTLTDKDIRAVTKKIDRAKKQLDA